jgi:hypothetical protein
MDAPRGGGVASLWRWSACRVAGQRGGCERAGGGLLSWKWLVDRRDGRGGVVVHLLLCGEQAGLGGSEPLEPGAYCQVVEPTWPGVWPAE